MFTGLVQDTGRIISLKKTGGPMRLSVKPDILSTADMVRGESIAVSGPCLTVVGTDEGVVHFDAGIETVQSTAISRWAAGRRVNLERALRLGDRLGGHLVSGHIDCEGRVLESRRESGVLQIRLSLPDEIAHLVCEKGSIAVDGVSLTVNETGPDFFRITLIPETVESTTLGELGSGDYVNLEADIIARHLARMVNYSKSDGESSLNMEFLARSGYL